MKICLFSYMFKWYPLEKAFSISKACGFDGLEVWGGRPHAYPFDVNPQRVLQIKALSKQYGLEIPVFTPEVLGYPYNLCSRLEKERNEAKLYLKRSLEIAAAIGAEKMLLAFDHAGYGRDQNECRKILRDSICELGSYAEKCGTKLMIEAVTLMESNIVYRLEDIQDLLTAAANDYVVAMIDTAPLALHQEPFSDYVEALGTKLEHIHFVDCDGKGPHHYNIGEAGLPMNIMMEILQKHGYDKYLCVELIWPYVKDPELYAYDTAIRLKHLFEKISIVRSGKNGDDK